MPVWLRLSQINVPDGTVQAAAAASVCNRSRRMGSERPVGRSGQRRYWQTRARRLHLFEWALERSGRRDWSVLLPALLKGSLTCHLPSRAPYADLVESHRACSGEESVAFGGSSFRILFPRRQRDTTRLE